VVQKDGVELNLTRGHKMKFNRLRTGILAIAFGIAGNGMTVTAAHAEEFSFTATNSTGTLIKEILVSENKSDWGYFDIGKGIKPGTTVDLAWDQSTNSENCTQWVKAAYADGSESEPAKFDFCENGLELEF
jgi:hypothetical protein